MMRNMETSMAVKTSMTTVLREKKYPAARRTATSTLVLSELPQ